MKFLKSLTALLLCGAVIVSTPAFAQNAFQPSGTGNGANVDGSNTTNPTFLQNITGSILSYSDSTLSLQSGKMLISSAGWIGLGASPSAVFQIGIATSSPAWTTNGIAIRQAAVTHTDTSSSGTVAEMTIDSIAAPTVSASNTTTYSFGSTFRINGPPVAGANVTFTDKTDLYLINTNAGGVGDALTIANLSSSANSETSIFFKPSTAAGLVRGARISAIQEDGSNSIGFKFYTGIGAAITSKMQLLSNGFLGLGGTPAAQLHLQGNISAAAWTTNGIKLRGGGSTLTDTSSSGTVAAAYTNALGGNTIAASSATTYTNYYGLYLTAPTAGTNVTMTNNWALGADTARIATSFRLAAPGTDATHTDATLCRDTTTGDVLTGTGAAGICLGTSSLRFKHDVAQLAPGLTQIAALQPIAYRYNKGYGDDGARVLYGFAAEQVETIMPELVGRDTEGRPNSVDWAGIVPVLVNAVKELKADNDNIHRELRRNAR